MKTKTCLLRIAGAGKSVLASNVLEYVANKYALDPEVGIGFAFYNYQTPEFRDLSLIIAAIMKQLCRKKASVPSWLLKIKQDAFNPSMVGKLDSFVSLAQTFQETILVIDALDECPKDDRPRILEFVSKVISDLPRAKIFITSRMEADIARAFEERSTPTIEIQAKSTKADISLYVNSEVSRLLKGVHGKKLFLRDKSLEADIVSVLTQESNGMFLWVNLQLQNLCRVSEAKKDSLVKSALRELPKGLDQTYTRMMKQIYSQHQYMCDLALTAFKWVLWAKRPLHMSELRAALSFRAVNKSSGGIEIDEEETILEACGNLLVEKLGKVTMLHFSANEFLLERSFMSSERFGFKDLTSGRRIHTELALMCLYRLLMDDSTRLWYLPDFKKYAACHFDYHVLHGELSEQHMEYVNRLLGLREHILSGILRERLSSSRPIGLAPIRQQERVPSLTASDFIYGTTLYQLSAIRERWTGSSPPKFALSIAASSGNLEAVKYLVEQGCRIDQELSENATALYYASKENHFATTEFLLDKGANVNAIGGNFGTALQAAALRGSLGILKLLLDRGADTNVRAGYYGSALQASLLSNNADATIVLLDAGADVNTPGGQFGCALQAAACRGSVRIAKLLLDNGANVNLQGGFYRCALQAAVSYGEFGMVALLVHKGADVNMKGGYFGCALQAATRHADGEKLVSFLLERGADVNLVGGFHDSALIAASAHGNENVVKILLEKGANINWRSERDGTALEIAIQTGHENVANLLRSKGAV